MYSKFKIEKLFYIEKLSEKEKKEYLEKGEKIFSTQKEEINRKIEEYLLPDKSIDVQRLSEDWFKDVESDIFISHSHKDEKEAIILSGILYEKFKLKCFINSTVWGNSLDLLKKIDKSINKKENTASPWIFSEIEIANSIRIIEPRRYKIGYAENYEFVKDLKDSLSFSYQANLDQFYDIDDKIFEDWLGKKTKSNKHSLDILYGVIEERKKL